MATPPSANDSVSTTLSVSIESLDTILCGAVQYSTEQTSCRVLACAPPASARATTTATVGSLLVAELEWSGHGGLVARAPANHSHEPERVATYARERRAASCLAVGCSSLCRHRRVGLVHTPFVLNVYKSVFFL
jgi:hypothetical protein